MKKIKIWDLQTRIFHWSLTFFITCTFVLASVTTDTDAWLAIHVAAGIAVGLLLLFRIFWGLAGSTYARFRDFQLSITELIKYLRVVSKKQTIRYTGHNPATSWITIIIIAIGFTAVLTGAMVYGVEESRGLLSFLYDDYYYHAVDIKHLHYLAAIVLFWIIAVHVSGVIVEAIRHKTGIIATILTGNKSVPDEANPSASIKGIPAFLSFLWLILVAPLTLYIYYSIDSAQPKLMTIPKIYSKECGACHMAFPPNLLPRKSWHTIMSRLDDHFGEDASLDAESRDKIEVFLVSNPAETSNEEAAIKILEMMRNKNAPALKITDTEYYKLKHDDIKPEVFNRDSVKNKANCTACHKWAEYGSFEDNDIEIPK